MTKQWYSLSILYAADDRLLAVIAEYSSVEYGASM